MSREGFESITGELLSHGSDLLTQFDIILGSDPPIIDEVGFIHPSQFSLLDPSNNNNRDLHFWKGEGKLGISTNIVLPLYKAAREAFFSAMNSSKVEEREVMKRSKALLLLSSDLATAWNARKLIVAKKQHIPTFIDELVLSALVLSYSPKSEQAWCHRRWVIKMIAGKCPTLPEILAKESDLVEKMAERSKMNYRAWNHRCWLVSYMTRGQVLHELKKSRSWAGFHVADNSCFHYRTKLLIRSLGEPLHEQGENSTDPNSGLYQNLQEELDWNEELIKRYTGREALWLHRRFLSLFWMRHFTTHPDAIADLFLDNELRLVNSCLTIPDNEFEDFQAQALYSATYILWLIKAGQFKGFEVQDKLNARSLKTLLNMEYPERSSLWNSVLGYQELGGFNAQVKEDRQHSTV